MPTPFPYRKLPANSINAGPVVRNVILWSGLKSFPVKALIDSGAAATTITTEAVEELEIEAKGDMPVGNASGTEKDTPFYIADVEVFGQKYPRTKLYLMDPKREYILLGRDILNEHRIHLEGPDLRFFVDPEPEVVDPE